MQPFSYGVRLGILSRVCTVCYYVFGVLIVNLRRHVSVPPAATNDEGKAQRKEVASVRVPSARHSTCGRLGSLGLFEPPCEVVAPTATPTSLLGDNPNVIPLPMLNLPLLGVLQLLRPTSETPTAIIYLIIHHTVCNGWLICLQSARPSSSFCREGTFCRPDGKGGYSRVVGNTSKHIRMRLYVMT